ncbi:MAG TPA: class I SAM-dependent methyltransferase [Bdellovibrionota bacterium]
MSPTIAFWEKRILAWEKRRYSHPLFLPLYWNLRKRLRITLKMLESLAPENASVLELGCGSGILASRISCGKYLGVDTASAAIKRAEARFVGANFAFRQANALDVAGESCEFDITAFLGLTDWLSENETSALFSSLRSPTILFSYTEAATARPWQPYSIYRNVFDRFIQKNAIRARSMAGAEIDRLLARSGYRVKFRTRASFLNPSRVICAEKA